MSQNYDPADEWAGEEAPAPSTLDNSDDSAGGDLVLFDHIVFSLMLRFMGTGNDARRQLALGLKAAGLLRPNQKLTAPLQLSIEVQLEEGVPATATAVLYVRELNDGVVIGGASTVDMNPQYVVRALHRIPKERVGLDGKRNFSKPTSECDTGDLKLQFDAIHAVVEKLENGIGSSLAGSELVEGYIQIRQAEVCHDSAYVNAEDVVRASGRVPPMGSRETSQREYACTTGAGRSPSWRVQTRKRGPTWKGYLKAPGLARTELSAGHRDAVVDCMGGRTQEPFGPDGAVQLAIDFYNRAGELCCEALDHVRQVANSGGRTLHDLLVALDPLKAIGDRDRVGNGYRPSERSAAEARRILNGLLTEGIAYATGLRKGTKVRDTLEELAVPGGPLVRGASQGIFCLAPEYGMAVPGWQGQFPLVLRG
jgi:hypothetical protein